MSIYQRIKRVTENMKDIFTLEVFRPVTECKLALRVAIPLLFAVTSVDFTPTEALLLAVYKLEDRDEPVPLVNVALPFDSIRGFTGCPAMAVFMELGFGVLAGKDEF